MDKQNQRLPLILASQSPRRKELLTEAGYTFTVRAPDDSVEKGVCSKCSPDQLVVDSAVAKAAAIASQSLKKSSNPAIVLAADTVGVCKAEVLGKPADVDHAQQMLRLMSGTVHDVLTGVCLWHLPSNRFLTFLEKTTVEMDVLSDEMIQQYLDTDLWIGKAGAFGFQDGLDWVRIVEGLSSTVVGLPVERLPQWMAALQEKVD
jgi:septum formation protein